MPEFDEEVTGVLVFKEGDFKMEEVNAGFDALAINPCWVEWTYLRAHRGLLAVELDVMENVFMRSLDFKLGRPRLDIQWLTKKRSGDESLKADT